MSNSVQDKKNKLDLNQDLAVSAEYQSITYRHQLPILPFDSTEKIQTDSAETEQSLKTSFTSQAIQALTTMFEMRDPYTYNHQKRVASLAKAIATQMDFSKKHIDKIYLAAFIHDIGKFRIPIEILCKPGKLDDLEFSMVKTHSLLGYEILNKIELLGSVAQIVLQHHERLNGSGYPQGLLADAISIEAKIIGVADVIEAMSSHRPYRPALGLENALAEIAQHRETLYDSVVVDACIKVIRENGFAFNQILYPQI